jgi:hypothetical protein
MAAFPFTINNSLFWPTSLMQVMLAVTANYKIGGGICAKLFYFTKKA